MSAELVSRILGDLRSSSGWAVLKGWDKIPNLGHSDLDLIVDPVKVEDVAREATAALARHAGPGHVVFRCDHVPGVPRLLTVAPEHGYGTRTLDIDLATVVPLRAAPIITYRAVAPYLVCDPRGFLRPTERVNYVMDVLLALPWAGNAGAFGQKIPASDFGFFLSSGQARLAATAMDGFRIAGVLFSTTLLINALIHNPKLFWSRLLFHSKWRLGYRCPADPRHGRASREVGSREAFIRSMESRHRMVSTG